MSRERDRNGRRCTSGRLAVIALASVLSGSARAGDDATPDSKADSVWTRVLETLNLRTKVSATPDFVRTTHPDSSKLEFIPTSTPHPKRSVPVKSVGEIEATKQALDAARGAQLNPRARAPVPASAQRQSAKPKPAADQN